MATQPGHFFDRVPAKDAAAAGVPRAYPFRDDVTGRYFLADSIAVAGATRVYFKSGAGDSVHLDDAEGDRTAILFGTNRVQL